MVDVYQTFHLGVNIFVVREGKLLLGKRKNIFGDGTWGLPGGHLETGEAMAAAAARELKEETNLEAGELEFSNVVNDRSGKDHYIQVGFVAKSAQGEPENMEPERCAVLEWFDIQNLPAELFPPHVNQINNFLSGNKFADA